MLFRRTAKPLPPRDARCSAAESRLDSLVTALDAAMQSRLDAQAAEVKRLSTALLSVSEQLAAIKHLVKPTPRAVTASFGLPDDLHLLFPGG